MKKILILAANIMLCIGVAQGGVRDGTALSRTKNDKANVQSRVITTKRNTGVRSATLVPRVADSGSRSANVVERSATTRNVNTARAAAPVVSARSAQARTMVSRSSVPVNVARASIKDAEPALMRMATGKSNRVPRDAE